MKRFNLSPSFRLTVSLLFLILSLAVFSGCGGGSAGGSTASLTGVVTLSWTPPNEYSDTTYLPPGDIAGYTIYFGEKSRNELGHYEYSVPVGNVLEKPLDHLPAGKRLYFAVTTTDVLGVEGSYSAEASTVL